MQLRYEAILMLEKRGAVLDTARRVSAIFRDAGIDAAVIGGVAVFLHGYERTTMDVDVFVPGPTKRAADALKDAGLKFIAPTREFRSGKVPVHLVDSTIAKPAPAKRSTIEDVVTVSLADLINLKLQSGTANIARTQDIADVIGLIRANRLNGAFAAKVSKPLRSEFRKLVNALG
jgi:hypothetical protein